MLVDTDIFIWYMRGQEGAARFLAETGRFSLSAVTYMELIQGMRNKEELQALRRSLNTWKTPVLLLNDAITSRAMALVEERFLSNALRMADALIAATAIEHGLPVATANDKHFRAVQELTLKVFRPQP